MDRNLNYAIGLWYENGGLQNIKLEGFFMICKILMIHIIFSLPFVLNFYGLSTNLESDVYWQVKIPGFYIYLSIVHYLIGFVILKRTWQIINILSPYRQTFINHGLDIDNVLISAKEASEKIGISYEIFANDALQIENLINACEESGHFKEKRIGSLLWTLPFEIVIKDIFKSFWFDDNRIFKLSRMSDSISLFKKLCVRLGILILPFLLNLTIYAFFNHLLTHSSNNSLLNSYNYSRQGRWNIRLYNEFDVDCRKRMDKTYTSLETVIGNYRNTSRKTIIYKILSFISGTISFIFLFFTFYGYTKLISVDLYTIIAIFTGFSALIYPRKNTENSFDSEILYINLKKKYEISELNNLAENKFVTLFKEITSIVLLPVLFLYWLPEHAFFICNFVNTSVSDNYVLHSVSKNKGVSEKSSRSHELCV